MNDNKKTSKPNVAAAIGAGIVGAAVGAGAAYIADKDNREKITKALEGIKKQGEKVMAKTEKQLSKTKEDIAETVEDMKPKTKKQS